MEKFSPNQNLALAAIARQAPEKMSAATPPASLTPRIRAAVTGGLIAGTVDIGAACAINFVGPVVVTQAIASGLLGRSSFKDGISSALLGLVLQWAIGIIVALIYTCAVDVFHGLRSRWILGGLIAGVVTFFVMNYVVLRLSAVGRFAHFTATGFIQNLAAILVFGLIISYFARTRGTTR